MPVPSRRTFLQSTLAAGAAMSLARAQADEEPAAPSVFRPAADAVENVGTRWELSVDEYLIARRSGLQLVQQTPRKEEVVLELDRPWEGPNSAYFTIFRDGPKYRLYYRGARDIPRGNLEDIVFCCAESSDGVQFERPAYGLYDFPGAAENNIVYCAEEGRDSFMPFLDENPAAPSEEKYKALVSPGSGTLHGAVSADGLRWRLLQDEPITTDGAFDTLNIGFWDPLLAKYRLFSRYLDVQGCTTNAERNRAVWETGTPAPWRRAIQSSLSDDFLRWSPPVPHAYPAGTPWEHLYTNATVRCPGAEHLLLSFPMRFDDSRTLDQGQEYPGVSDALCMTSRDGVHWDRSFASAWVAPDGDERNWTHRCNMPAHGIVETGDGRWSLYISEHFDWPTNRLRRLSLRRHGLGAWTADRAGGELLTRPLTAGAGGMVRLNFATSAVGSIRVEVQDATGRPLAGYGLDDCQPLFGDKLHQVVAWKDGFDLSAVLQQPVRLRFELREAQLFAWQFFPFVG